MEQDWDNLVILDACRYDLFKEVNTIDGRLTPVISRGSSTREFLQSNFRGREFFDTIYISANPQLAIHNIFQSFFDHVPLWEDHWDDNLRTVLPSDVVQQTMRVHKENPNKRLIVHFIQPHYPFIGPTGSRISHGSLYGDGIIADERDERSIWSQLKDGIVEKQVVEKAYRENLELVLPHIRDLISRLNGKSAVTSDHGNSFGRWGIYGHPGKRFLMDLVKVPWLDIDTDSRREITSGQMVREHDSSEKNEITDRLEDLGYL